MSVLGIAERAPLRVTPIFRCQRERRKSGQHQQGDSRVHPEPEPWQHPSIPVLCIAPCSWILFRLWPAQRADAADADSVI